MKTKPTGFTRKRRTQREKRDRISLRKDSKRTLEVGRKPLPTVAGSRRPSTQTGYARDLRGVGVDKAYGDQGYRKGMNKRPRRKLTLGNMVMRKARKRVEGVEAKHPTQVGGQRQRQRLRVFWDGRNQERTQVQVAYRGTTARDGRRSPGSRGEKALLRQGLTRYLKVRGVERARNQYEVRSRYQTHERGKKRKAWSLEGKYGLGPLGSIPGAKVARADLEGRRQGWKEAEAQALETRYATRLSQARTRFEGERAGRQARCVDLPGRGDLAHVRTLRERGKKTQEAPRQGKHREAFVVDEGEGLTRVEAGEGDESREILFAAPRTQYFSKRKNLSRSLEREKRGQAEAGKWRKVPEKDRRERRPTWADLDAWMNRRTQEGEDRNRDKLLLGESLSGSDATYVELGKKVLYWYGCQRSQRWEEPKRTRVTSGHEEPRRTGSEWKPGKDGERRG